MNTTRATTRAIQPGPPHVKVPPPSRVPLKAPKTRSRALLETPPERPDLVSVRLRYSHPTAGQVYAAGDFNQWDARATPMRRLPDGTWITDLILAPGTYEYRYVADGVWHDDPNAAAVTHNPFGGINAVLQVDRVAK